MCPRLVCSFPRRIFTVFRGFPARLQEYVGQHPDRRISHPRNQVRERVIEATRGPPLFAAAPHPVSIWGVGRDGAVDRGCRWKCNNHRSIKEPRTCDSPVSVHVPAGSGGSTCRSQGGPASRLQFVIIYSQVRWQLSYRSLPAVKDRSVAFASDGPPRTETVCRPLPEAALPTSCNLSFRYRFTWDKELGGPSAVIGGGAFVATLRRSRGARATFLSRKPQTWEKPKSNRASIK